MISVHVTPQKFKNGSFTLKTPQMFSVHVTTKKFENGSFTLKTRQMFPCTLCWRTLKTQVSL